MIANYKNKNIYSNYLVQISAGSQTNVKDVPIFKDNKTIQNSGFHNITTFNQEDSNAFNHFLETNNADYYFSLFSQDLNI